MMGRRLAWLTGLIGVSAVCSLGMAHALRHATPSSTAPAPLPVRGEVPPFSLTDQHGRTLTRGALEGRVWVADFIFATCAGQCLLMSDEMGALQRALAKETALRFVSFSVDPVHDTPEVLAAYAARYGADARWLLVTGPRQAIYRLCQEGFHLAVGEDPRSPREPIVHSVRFVLVDRAGRIRGYYEATDARAMARLRDETRRVLSEGE